MNVLRVTLNAVALCLITLASVIVGFAAYHVVGPSNQLAVQVPVATVLVVLSFALWSIFSARSPWRDFSPRGQTEWTVMVFAALLCTPIVFIPLHYITQGYLTAVSNIGALWIFQAPVSIMAAFVARGCARRTPITQ